MIGDAIFSPDRRYRYWLHREISGMDNRTCLWIGLNPSTASEMLNDPTIRREIGFTYEWGFGEMTKVNLFGLVDSDPMGLLKVGDPIGIENVINIEGAIQLADRIVCAWGTHRSRRILELRQPTIERIVFYARLLRKKLWCLGTTRDGSPAHPLYLARTTKLTLWRPTT